MRDKNFFELYVDKKDISSDKKNIITIIGASALALLVVYTGINLARIPFLNKDIQKISKELSRDDLNQKKVSADEKKELLSELDKIESELEYVSLDIEQKDILGSHLIEAITDSMPREIFLKSIDITDEFITLEGISRTKEDIARLEGKFRRVSYFKNVFIPEISAEEEFFNFRVDLSLSHKDLVKRDKSAEQTKVVNTTEEGNTETDETY